MKIEHIEIGRTDDPVEVAKSFIRWHIENGIPTTLEQAREFYRDAKLPMPTCLIARNWTEEELLEEDMSGRMLFRVYLK